jgi:hypothetical protein
MNTRSVSFFFNPQSAFQNPHPLGAMSAHLRNYLFDAYKSPRNFFLPKANMKTAVLQIDDQDDTDSIAEFCNIFCTVGKKTAFTVEFSGRFPITQEMADLVEIYNGSVDRSSGKLSVTLNLNQIAVLRDLSDKLRKTSFLGDMVNNPGWLGVSARTISSIYRFMRIIEEYKKSVRS